MPTSLRALQHYFQRALCVVLPAVLLASTFAQANEPPVKAPFDAWLAAFNARDTEALGKLGAVTAKSAAEIESTGGLEIVRADLAGHVAMAFAKAKKDARLFRIEFIVSSDQPPQPLMLTLRPINALPKPTANGWQRVEGGPNTGCALGTPFHFYFRAANPKKLAVHFQGGGACWNSNTCNIGAKRWFDHSVDDRDDPTTKSGVLDVNRADNPFKDYSILFVPYCTADVHMGRREATYTLPTPGGGEAKLNVRHNGANNVNDALAWLDRQMPGPEDVVVMGDSAGSIASPVYATRLAARFPMARIVQIGDGSGIYRSPLLAGTAANWSLPDVVRAEPAYRTIDPATLTHEQYYTLGARHAPRIRFAQINSAEDAVQVSFMEQAGERDIIPARLIRLGFEDIDREVKQHKSFTLPGKDHTILLRAEFYSAVVDGVKLTDWVADHVRGNAVRNVGQSLLK
jgi:hypothetical protein